MKTVFWYILAAVGEIVGCYAFWQWLRMKQGILPLAWGIPALLIFAFALARIDVAHAGRVYAAYSAIYLVASLIWMRSVEGVSPDQWDMIGSGICLLGAAIIIFAPR
jgi:small multidrug resistance family-3 protein